MLKVHYHASLAEEETQVLQRSGDYQGEDNDSLFLPFFQQHLFQSTERQCQHTETHFWGVINQRNEVGVGGDSNPHMNFSKNYCKYYIVKIGLKQHDYINYIKLDLTFISASRHQNDTTIPWRKMSLVSCLQELLFLKFLPQMSFQRKNEIFMRVGIGKIIKT